MKHSMILQKLGEKLRNFGEEVFYPRETFESVDYTGKPVILWEGEGAPRHPDFRDVTAGRIPEGYRIVGEVMNTSLDGDLQRADADITDELISDEIRQNPSQFAVSTGFWGRIVDHVMKGVDAPNHILLFRRASGAPNDRFSQVVNTRDETDAIFPEQLDSGVEIMATSTTTKQITNTPPSEPAVDSKPVKEEEVQIAALIQENTELKALVEQLLAKLDEVQNAKASANTTPAAVATPVAPVAPVGVVAAPQTAAVGNTAEMNEIERLKAENAEMKKKCADAEWSTLEGSLPMAMRGTTGRAAYDMDPVGFMKRALAVGNTAQETAQVSNTTASGFALPTPPQEQTKSFLTAEYAYARQIGNAAAPAGYEEGTRLGSHLWALYGGMKLDSTMIDSALGQRRIGAIYGVI